MYRPNQIAPCYERFPIRDRGTLGEAFLVLHTGLERIESCVYCRGSGLRDKRRPAVEGMKKEKGT